MNPWIVLPSLVVVAIVFVVVPVGAAVYSRFRHSWRVPCPLERAEAQIGIDPLAAARAELIGGGEITVARCSLWPKRQGCEQRCLEVPLEQWRRSPAAPATATIV